MLLEYFEGDGALIVEENLINRIMISFLFYIVFSCYEYLPYWVCAHPLNQVIGNEFVFVVSSTN